MASLKWAPLPDGRPWWPCIVVDRDTLDARKHAEIIRFYNDMREKRGADDLNKDVLVLLCGLSKQDGGHRFAVVPKTSLRNFQLYANAFSDGIISSGVNAGKPCNSEERKQLRAVIASLGDLSRRANGAPPPPPPPPPVSASSSAVTSTSPVMSTKGSRAAKAMLDENKELVKLRKELQGVRRKMNSRSTSRPQSASPPTYDRAVSPVPNVPQMEAAAQSKYAPGQTIAEYYPEMTSQIIRMWDFCHSFSQELSLSQPGTQTAFASITSFEAAMSEPDCALFAQVASSLANYISVSKGSELVDQWNFSEDKLSARLGSRCTPLTWECLWDTLREKEIVSKPTDTSNKRDILDSLIQACCQMYSTKHVFGMRQSELASELSNAIEFQNNLPALQTQTELRSSVSPDVIQLRILSADVFQCKDFFTVERMIDACRADHEVVDPETGRVIARTPELCSALAWEEKLFAGVLSMIKRTQLAKRTRSLSFGKDSYGRSLFSFVGDDEEEDCRVWAREDATDRWYLYRGDLNLARLADLVQDPAARQMIVAILYSSKQRFRPASVAEHREAKLNGWRFGGNELLGRRVLHYTPEFGVIPGVIVSWRNVGPTQPRYRIVFTRQMWEHGMDMTDEEIIHLLACSDRPLGDFPMLAPNFTLPHHPFHVPWMPVASTESAFVLIPGHQKKLIGLGVIVARTAPLAEGECDVLVLQDGGEFVTIFGKKQLTDAITLANTFAKRPLTVFVDNIPVPRYPRVDRFRPLTHHCGPLVGLQGVIKLWGKIVVDSVTDLREPMLTSEQAFVIRAPALWPNPQAGETWRKFVGGATQVKEYAMALECLLFYAEKAVEKGYFTPPPLPAPGGEGAAQDGTVATASIAIVGGSMQQEEVPSMASPFKRQRQAEADGGDELDDDIGALEEEMKSAERVIAATIGSIQSTSNAEEQQDSKVKEEQESVDAANPPQLLATMEEAKVKTERDESQALISGGAEMNSSTSLEGAHAPTVGPGSNANESAQMDTKTLLLPPPEASAPMTTSAFSDDAASPAEYSVNNSKASTPRKASVSSSTVAERRSPRIAASPRRPVYSPKERASPREPRSTPRRVLPFPVTMNLTSTNTTNVVVGDQSAAASALESSKAIVVNERSEPGLEEMTIIPSNSYSLNDNVNDLPEVKIEEMPIISLSSSNEAANAMATNMSGNESSSVLPESNAVMVAEPVDHSSPDVVTAVQHEPMESTQPRSESTSAVIEEKVEPMEEEKTTTESKQQQESSDNDDNKAMKFALEPTSNSHLVVPEKGTIEIAPSSSSLEPVSNEQQGGTVPSSAGVVDDAIIQSEETKPTTESSNEMLHPSFPGVHEIASTVSDQRVEETNIESKPNEESVQEAEMLVEDDQHPIQHDVREDANQVRTTSDAMDFARQSVEEMESQQVSKVGNEEQSSIPEMKDDVSTAEVAHKQVVDPPQQENSQVLEGERSLESRERDEHSSGDQNEESTEL